MARRGRRDAPRAGAGDRFPRRWEQPLPCGARATGAGRARPTLQQARRPGVLRERPAASVHRAEGGVPEHPRGVRQQPRRLPLRAQHRPRVPPQCVPHREQWGCGTLRVDHRALGPFRRVEEGLGAGEGARGRRGAPERPAEQGAPPRHRRELHRVRRQPRRRDAQDRGAQPAGARSEQRGRIGPAPGGAQAAVPAGKAGG